MTGALRVSPLQVTVYDGWQRFSAGLSLSIRSEDTFLKKVDDSQRVYPLSVIPARCSGLPLGPCDVVTGRWWIWHIEEVHHRESIGLQCNLLCLAVPRWGPRQKFGMEFLR